LIQIEEGKNQTNTLIFQTSNHAAMQTIPFASHFDLQKKYFSHKFAVKSK